jgi:cytochrome b6-f complex iron-sulfur subunit
MSQKMNMHTSADAAQTEDRPARRRFLRWLLRFSVMSTLLGVATPVLSYLWPPAQAGGNSGGRVLVGAVTDFPVNTGKVVPVGNKPVIIGNTEAGGIKAFSAICTHLGCVTYWHEERRVIQSPCHDGRFSPVNGIVISGPPPRPLPEYELMVEKDQVYVGKVQGVIGPI